MSDPTRNETKRTRADNDANRDPLTGEPGAHPVGTGVGATGGAIAGAAVGAVAGPVGAAIGLIAGAVAGGLAGKQVAEKIDPTDEDEYWRTHYAEAPYAERGVPYDSWSTAYRVGYEGFQKHAGADFEAVEPALRGEYDRSKGESRLEWRKARLAARDAWMRLRARSIETLNAEPRHPKCGES